MLASLGFHVRMVRVPDVLPYPHVVIAATRSEAGPLEATLGRRHPARARIDRRCGPERLRRRS